MSKAKTNSRSTAKGPKAEGPEQAKARTSPWEWAVAALGGLMIIAALGYMAYYGFTHPQTPPNVTVEVREVSPLAAGFLVEFEARNSGNSTAAGLVISGELRSGDAVAESSETTLDYLPEQSRRLGGLFFQNDPSQYDLSLRAEGYVAP
jgi:uncharacterized protein (TIGR02588 family)